MRISNGKKNGVEIDLTSMLDVIFIILIVVMCSVAAGGESNKDLAKANDDLTKQLKYTTHELTTTVDLVEAQDNLLEEVAIMVLHADYDADNPADRGMWLLRSTSEGEEEVEPERITLNNESREEAFLEIEQRIIDYLNSNEGIPVLISIDKSQILYRDYNQLDAMLTKMQEDYNNLFYTYKMD